MTRYWQYGKGMNGGTFPEGSYPVLLVHGFRGDHHGMEIIANYLLKLIPNVSIFSPDLPGFGRSADLPENTRGESTQGADNINAYVAWLNDFVKHTNPAREDAQPLPLHVVGTPSAPSSPAPSPPHTRTHSHCSRSSTRSASPPSKVASASPPASPPFTTVPARHYPKKLAIRCCARS